MVIDGGFDRDRWRITNYVDGLSMQVSDFKRRLKILGLISETRRNWPTVFRETKEPLSIIVRDLW